MVGPTAAANFQALIPRTANWGVSLNRQKFIVRLNWNYRAPQRRQSFSGASIEPGTFQYLSKRLYRDVNVEYYFWRRLALFGSFRNIGETPEDIKIYGPSTPAVARFRERIEYGALWSIGVKGTF
jgi:hypothetical protein